MQPQTASQVVAAKSYSEGSVFTKPAEIEFSRTETVHGELSSAAGDLAGGSRHSGPANETAPQRHRISRSQARRRHRRPSAPFTSSNNIIRRRQVEEHAPGRFLNTGHFERYLACIGIAAAVATQMGKSSEELEKCSIIFLLAISAVYKLESWAMSHKHDIHQAKWKLIVFGIAFNFAKLLCVYLLLCMLRPDWLRWYGFVIVCSIATAYTCFDELKTLITWCCKKVVSAIKVLKLIRKDQVSPASAPTRAYV